MISEEQRSPAIVILDFGSQYSELIARRIRETEVFSLVISYTTSAEQLRSFSPKGIILSGGPGSVYEEGAPYCDQEIFNLGVPVLGVCYGMQLMVHQLGGSVKPATGQAEYGKAPLEVDVICFSKVVWTVNPGSAELGLMNASFPFILEIKVPNMFFTTRVI